jgi:hypothetical protein
MASLVRERAREREHAKEVCVVWCVCVRERERKRERAREVCVVWCVCVVWFGNLMRRRSVAVGISVGVSTCS